MSRTRNAALTATFTYAQFALALVSGFVLFPVIVRHIGAYDNGLWLATGEVIGYLLLGDLGVFAIVPWVVANKDGAGDRAGAARILTDALGIGVGLGLIVLAAAAGVWVARPEHFGFAAPDWEKIRPPLALVLGLTGLGVPFRAFQAFLAGMQDVVFGGMVSVAQTGLTIILTITFIVLGFGLPGLALATGLPPLLAGWACAVRVVASHREIARQCGRPSFLGCRYLVGQGFGPWLAGFGVRLLTASNGLILVAHGRPDLATVYAATGKVAQSIQPMCAVLPDSGLIGLSQLHGGANPDQTRRTVLCLILLYVLIPGAAAGAILLVNPVFVRVWLGSEYYAGNSVNILIAVNLLLASVAGGLFKLSAVVGQRPLIGTATLIYGVASAGLGYWLFGVRGLIGLAGAAAIVSGAGAIPFGLLVVTRAYDLRIRDLLTGWIGPGVVRGAPFLAAAATAGVWLADQPLVAALPAGLILGGLYFVLVRPVLANAPWPDRVRGWLTRLRLIPTS